MFQRGVTICYNNNNNNITMTTMNLILFTLFSSLFVSTADARLFGDGGKFNNTINFAQNISLCQHIRPDELPEECSCSEPSPFSLVIECLKDFSSPYWNDTIGMKINVDPCNKDGSRVALEVTEEKHNIDYPITGIRAGEANMIPIPGLSIAVPTVGHVGIDAAVLFTGNPDSLTLKIGLDGCIQLPTSSLLCASRIPGLNKILPWYVLSGTYSFGDICKNERTGILEASVAERDAVALIEHKQKEQEEEEQVEAVAAVA